MILRGVCPFCGTEQRTRSGNVWLFARHSPPLAVGAVRFGGACAGSLALLPVPNLWTTMTRLAELREDPTVDITISRDVSATHVTPGDTIAHPDTGKPFHVIKMGLGLGDVITLTGSPASARSRSVRLEVKRGDTIQILPTDEEAARIWSAIADAVDKARAWWIGEGNPDAHDRTANAMAEPPCNVHHWPTTADLPTLEIAAGGRRWDITASTVAEQLPAPADAEG